MFREELKKMYADSSYKSIYELAKVSRIPDKVKLKKYLTTEDENIFFNEKLLIKIIKALKPGAKKVIII